MLLLVYGQDALEHPWCDLVYLTDVMADFDCDVFFPEFDRALFKVQERYVFISYYGAGRPDLEAVAPHLDLLVLNGDSCSHSTGNLLSQ